MDGTALEYIAPIGLFLDIVGFTLVFWKGDFFSPRVFAGSGPPPPDFLETGPETPIPPKPLFS